MRSHFSLPWRQAVQESWVRLRLGCVLGGWDMFGEVVVLWEGGFDR